ncbi:hypothetical protein [Microbacterium sp. NPDC096154]|uniref:hypothetical protein n=1 Tax=Microbacterium sp. NPDC096154 TaxID=3155549 RepID=UPI00332DC1D1
MSHEINSFRPVATPEWDAVADFVKSHVHRYAGERKPAAVRQAMSVLAAYAAWIHRTHAASLTEQAFAPQLIDYYAFTVRTKSTVQSTAARERKLLRTIAGLHTGVEQGRATTSAQPVAPYSSAEIARFRTWADLQPTRYRAGCIAIVALGAACGLTRAEMSEARGEDIIDDADGLPSMRVRVGRLRVVPAMLGWEADFALLAAAGDKRLLPVAYDQVYAHYDDVQGQERPSPQRLRATWMVNQLNARVQVPVLLAAAGLTSADSLRRFLPFVEPPAAAEQLRMLRGAGAKQVQA